MNLIKSICVVPTCLVLVAQGAETRRPNIVYIFTDEQSAKMMSCTGNPWLETPAMDYIAENGVRFERLLECPSAGSTDFDDCSWLSTGLWF